MSHPQQDGENNLLDAVLRGKHIERYLPIVGWIARYDRAWLRDDLVSGVVVGAVMIPVAMAYAQMAGVPPQAGLYSAIVGMIAYAILATSRHLKVTTSSTMSIMSIAVVAPLAAGDAAALMALTSALAITVGIIMLVLGLLKLGFVSDFLSKSVMTGYIFGVAMLIAISQLPKVFGIPGGSGTFLQQLAQFVANLPLTNPYSLALGAGAIALILVVRRVRPLVPGALIALALSIVITTLLDLNGKYGVSVVGVIPIGMSSPMIPAIDPRAIPFLIAGAAGIVFLAVGESLGTARAYAGKYHYEVDPDQELFALGTANISSGLFQGITIDMSLSNTASGDAAGVRTQLSGLVSAGVILATVFFLAPLFVNLPTAVLGAIVLTSTLGLFNVSELKRYYRQRRTDFALALTALVGVAVSDVMTGLLLAVFLSLVMLLYRASRPYVAVLGRSPGLVVEYGDLKRHADYEPVNGLVMLRMDAPLYFFNANVARSEIRARAMSEPRPAQIILDLGASADLDIGTCDMLRDLSNDLRNMNVALVLTQVRSAVRDRMRTTGLMNEIHEDRIFASVDGAVQSYLAGAAPAPPAPAPLTEDDPAQS